MGRVSKGATLIELIIYMFLLSIILSLVFRIVVLNKKQSSKPMASFNVQQEFIFAQDALRQDLKETKLSTVKIYPNPDHPNATVGISLISPRTIDTNEIKTTPYGTPYWQKIIYYYLEKDPKREDVAYLVRKEGVISGLPSANPKASPYEPAKAPYDKRRKKIIARFIMLPHKRVPELNMTTGEYGGFEVFFLNPEGEKSITDFYDHPIVGVNLIFKYTSPTTGKNTVMEFPIKVYPRN